ncbi:MAG TPA: glycosyltransferase [Mycobacteriales bacterium]|nr:glycosyltransferase [Mycobacteriales bacterium]
MSAERPPDVCLIAPYPRLGVVHGGASGVASYTANLSRALTEVGATVTVVAPEQRGEPSVATDDAVQVIRAFRVGPRALPTAVAAARATRARVIHLQHELFLYGGPSALPGLFGALRQQRRGDGARRVVTMHQVVDPRIVDRDFVRLHRIGVPPHAARLAISTVQRSITSLSDVVIVHEPAFIRHLPNAVAVPHGVETPASVDRAHARADLGLDDRLVALCFGFVAPYKGLETALDAARITGPSVQVVVAGTAHPRLEQRHGYAAGLRREYGDVARFTGFVEDDDVARWFRAADVVLLPYPAPHASSGALALALAHDTPVLSSAAMTRTCGLPGALSFTTAEDLAGRLLQLVNQRDGLGEMRSALAGMRAERSWSSVARRHLDLYTARVA